MVPVEMPYYNMYIYIYIKLICIQVISRGCLILEKGINGITKDADFAWKKIICLETSPTKL